MVIISSSSNSHPKGSSRMVITNIVMRKMILLGATIIDNLNLNINSNSNKETTIIIE